MLVTQNEPEKVLAKSDLKEQGSLLRDKWTLRKLEFLNARDWVKTTYSELSDSYKALSSLRIRQACISNS